MYSIFLQYKLYSVPHQSGRQGEERRVGAEGKVVGHWSFFFTALETQFESELASEWFIHKWESRRLVVERTHRHL